MHEIRRNESTDRSKYQCPESSLPHRHHHILSPPYHCTLTTRCTAIPPQVLCPARGTGYPRRVLRLCPIILLGCLPGDLHTPWEEVTRLRTALFSTNEDDNGGRRWTVFLSSGDIPCALPDTEDPAAGLLARSEVYTGLCGEGARHVLLEARRPAGVDNETRYSGTETLDLSSPGVTMRSYAVLEASRTGDEDEPGAWLIEDDVAIGPAGDGGFMEVTRATAQEFHADFSFPVEGLSGRFRARSCEEERDLFDRVTVTGYLPCPVP